MNTGASTTPAAVTPNRISPRVPAVRSTSSRTSSRERPSSYSAKTGTKAWENDPAAKNRRKMFGMRNATKKASITTEAPKNRAKTMSRTRPRIRDSSVNDPTSPVERSRPRPVTGPRGESGGDAIGAPVYPRPHRY